MWMIRILSSEDRDTHRRTTMCLATSGRADRAVLLKSRNNSRPRRKQTRAHPRMHTTQQHLAVPRRASTSRMMMGTLLREAYRHQQPPLPGVDMPAMPRATLQLALRWNHQRAYSPGSFIPTATQWTVLGRQRLWCGQCRKHQQSGQAHRHYHKMYLYQDPKLLLC